MFISYDRLFVLGQQSPPPFWARFSSFESFLYHTQRRTTFGRSPLDEWSARRRDLYLITHNTPNIQTSMLPVGFETTISAGERPQNYALDRADTWDRLLWPLKYLIVQYPVPTEQMTVIWFRVKSRNVLLHMLLASICSYLKSVLRYTRTFLNLMFEWPCIFDK